MQIGLSLGLGCLAQGAIADEEAVDPGTGTTPPEITRLEVLAQTAENNLPVELDLSEPCDVLFVLTTSATTPTAAQIAAGQDQSGNVAQSSGTLISSDFNTYLAPLEVGLQTGTYYLHAYPANANGVGTVVGAGPIAFTSAV